MRLFRPNQSPLRSLGPSGTYRLSVRERCARGVSYARFTGCAVWVLATLVSLGAPWSVNASRVQTGKTQRTVSALVGPILFIAAESKSSESPTVRSWSAEENLGGGSTNLVSGQLSVGDLTVGPRRIVVDTGSYVLKCASTAQTKRIEDTAASSLKIVSYDRSKPIFASENRKSIMIGSLDCTLKTPDGRSLAGTGSYSKRSERTMGSVDPVP